ncbi:MAG: 3' terminal RNA ribose 2'-O-methyltransferase Hen1 [Rhizobiaceae bacterium]|nr:3' terminal RNA ribose 2'-O-methyltransferase Hen1 [Rhizobiaceae bacterium]
MQIEITLRQDKTKSYSATDLGFLLHKHPAHMHERDTGAGKAIIFYPCVSEDKTTSVLYLDIDPVALVRGKNQQSDGLLAQYVNDRPYVANSFLSVALGRSFGQSMSGKSKERQELADTELPFEAKVTPVGAAGGLDTIKSLFEPLGYNVEAEQLAGDERRGIFELKISGTVLLRDLLNHLYVLVPVLDNAKHYWIDREEIEKLLAKGEGWLKDHPAKELIAKRALKHRRGLAFEALQRLADADVRDEADSEQQTEAKNTEQEADLEKPIRLHDLRLDTVASLLKDKGVNSVLDLGCGEGKLLKRLVKERSFSRLVGVDPSVASLERASSKLHLDNAGDALRKRLQLQMGSLTYADRRWHGFDAATLVEVIEHIDPPRLQSLALSLFGDAAPRYVVITTPNIEYNALFEGMEPGKLRHSDHRFEWTRKEFEDWCQPVANDHGYTVEILPLGPIDETHGAPSQMAVFERI